MRRYFVKSLMFLILAVLSAGCLTGCGEESRFQNADTIKSAKDGYKGGGLICETIASFYNGFDSPYLTRHLFHFKPGAKSLTITGEEPGGVIMWSVSSGGFSFKGTGDNTVKGGIDKKYYTRQTASAVLYSLLASVGAAEVKESAGDAVRIEGVWYEPAEKNVSGGTVTYYRSADSGRVELLSFISDDGEQIWSRIYNYRYFANIDRVMAGNIELSRHLEQDRNNIKAEIILELDFRTYINR